ncbi:hypothetical protein [Sphingopyxis sp. GW247-27LB]|uniref:hypothetical protein n=1 Tax=Sphingopyxis sp. GW247-27LB TaxID=2012632 RepID=UPI000BA5E1A1|nr:hypothetical protein [Sphingopyxis sp. GW247-27LB]PAL23589.1 hypothetical protein CD928_05845 [Sphingopyxis sp. GW247-27LB]
MNHPHHIICQRVGMSYCPDRAGNDTEVVRLAECVRMVDKIKSNPTAVADEITRYLNDLEENP